MGTPIRALPAARTPQPDPQPTPCPRAERRGSHWESGFEAFPPCLEQHWMFWCLWPAWQRGDTSRTCPLPRATGSPGASPQEGPGCRSSTTPLIHGTRAADLSWGCQAAPGDPQRKENHPQIAEAGGALEAAPASPSPPGDPSPALHPPCAACPGTGAGFGGHSPRGKPLCSPCHAAFQEKAGPECTKPGSPKMPARNSCTPARMGAPGPAPCRAHRGFTSTPGRLGHS